MTDSTEKFMDAADDTMNKTEVNEEAVLPENDLEKALILAQQALEDQKQLHLRALADLDNIRRRAAREQLELQVTATAQLMEAILPALDSFRLGFLAGEHHTAHVDMLKGFKMAYDQLLQILQSNGLELIDPKGIIFDPHAHECVAQRSELGVDEGIVLEVVRVGYRLGKKLLRPASVIIASA